MACKKWKKVRTGRRVEKPEAAQSACSDAKFFMMETRDDAGFPTWILPAGAARTSPDTLTGIGSPPRVNCAVATGIDVLPTFDAK